MSRRSGTSRPSPTAAASCSASGPDLSGPAPSMGGRTSLLTVTSSSGKHGVCAESLEFKRVVCFGGFCLTFRAVRRTLDHFLAVRIKRSRQGSRMRSDKGLKN